jgi:hypothetical protein
MTNQSSPPKFPAMKPAADETQRLIERIKASFNASEWGTPQDSIYALLQEAAAALEAAAERERELREELAAEIRAGDLYRELNRRTAEALGKPFDGKGSSWHDIPDRVRALQEWADVKRVELQRRAEKAEAEIERLKVNTAEES